MKVSIMICKHKLPSYFAIATVFYFSTIPTFAGEYGSEFSANPDYSYESYNSSSNSYKPASIPTNRRNMSPQAHSFSGNVLVSRSRSQSSADANSGFTSSRGASFTPSASQSGPTYQTNYSATYRSSPYKY